MTKLVTLVFVFSFQIVFTCCEGQLLGFLGGLFGSFTPAAPTTSSSSANVAATYSIALAVGKTTIDSICSTSSLSSFSFAAPPTLIIGASNEITGFTKMRCASASFFNYSSETTHANLRAVNLLSPLWASGRWNVSEANPDNFESNVNVNIAVKNKSPLSLKIVGTTDVVVKRSQVYPWSAALYTVSSNKFLQYEAKLRWITDYVGNTLYGDFGFPVNGYNAAIMYSDIDVPVDSSAASISSKARFLLIEYSSFSNLYFYSHEAAQEIDVDLGNRKLLQVSASVSVNLGCPNGYCYRKPVFPPNCYRGCSAWPGCAIICVCG